MQWQQTDFASGSAYGVHSTGFTNPRSTLAAYSCWTCEGIHRWNGSNDGAQTKLTQRAIDGTDPQQYSTMETRLQVCTTSGCNYRVEAGISSTTSRPSPYYYWEDRKPDGSFYHNPIANVPSIEFGYGLKVFIWKNATSWSVQMNSTRSGGWAMGNPVYSTPNEMNGGSITIGTVVQGESGQSSPIVNYADNAYNKAGQWYWQNRPNPEPADYTSPSQPGIITVGWNVKPYVNGTYYNGGSLKVSFP